jgi:hypothetical protein
MAVNSSGSRRRSTSDRVTGKELPPEHREDWHVSLEEHLVLVVADDDRDVRFRGPDCPRELGDGGLAGVVLQFENLFGDRVFPELWCR